MSKNKKEVTETGLSTKSVFDLAKLGQEGIPQLLEVVKKKIAAITKGSEEVESTKGKRLPGFPELSSIDKVTVLVQAHSSVTGKANAYRESAKALDINLSKFPFKIEGCTEKQWVDDISRKVVILVNKAELDKLKETQKLLEDRLSEDDKMRATMEKVAKLLTDDSPLE